MQYFLLSNPFILLLLYFKSLWHQIICTTETTNVLITFHLQRHNFTVKVGKQATVKLVIPWLAWTLWNLYTSNNLNQGCYFPSNLLCGKNTILLILHSSFVSEHSSWCLHFGEGLGLITTGKNCCHWITQWIKGTKWDKLTGDRIQSLSDGFRPMCYI